MSIQEHSKKFNPVKAKQIFKLTHNSLSSAEIDGILAGVNRDSAALLLCAEGLQEAMAVDTNRLVRKGDLQFQTVRLATIDNGIKIGGVAKQLGGVEDGVQALEKQIDRKFDELKERESAVANANASGIDAQNGMARFLADVQARREGKKIIIKIYKLIMLTYS